jgi:outer membrane protein assembly factor BamB
MTNHHADGQRHADSIQPCRRVSRLRPWWTAFRSAIVVAMLVVSGASPASAAGSSPPNAPAGSVTTFQMNSRHDGYSSDQLSTPLAKLWSHTFPGEVGYPLIVKAQVFTIVTPTSGPANGTSYLYALQATTGTVDWGPVSLGTNSLNGITADGANVYDIDTNGLLRAFAQSTGHLVWSTQLNENFSAAPVVRSGVIYVAGASVGGELFAVNAATGVGGSAAALDTGDGSTPAVTNNGVFLAYPCEHAYRFAPITLATMWTHTTGCDGGGGRTPSVHKGLLYIRSAGNQTTNVLSLTSGKAEAISFPSFTAPAFDGDTGFFISSASGHTLNATNLKSGKVLWSVSDDGAYSTAPIAIGSDVAIGWATGRVSLYDGSTGRQLWSANAGAAINGDDEAEGLNQYGISESNHVLFVPATNLLVAYG